MLFALLIERKKYVVELWFYTDQCATAFSYRYLKSALSLSSEISPPTFHLIFIPLDFRNLHCLFLLCYFSPLLSTILVSTIPTNAFDWPHKVPTRLECDKFLTFQIDQHEKGKNDLSVAVDPASLDILRQSPSFLLLLSAWYSKWYLWKSVFQAIIIISLSFLLKQNLRKLKKEEKANLHCWVVGWDWLLTLKKKVRNYVNIS